MPQKEHLEWLEIKLQRFRAAGSFVPGFGRFSHVNVPLEGSRELTTAEEMRGWGTGGQSRLSTGPRRTKYSSPIQLFRCHAGATESIKRIAFMTGSDKEPPLFIWEPHFLSVCIPGEEDEHPLQLLLPDPGSESSRRRDSAWATGEPRPPLRQPSDRQMLPLPRPQPHTPARASFLAPCWLPALRSQ